MKIQKIASLRNLPPLERYIALRQILHQFWQEAVESPETLLKTAAHIISLRQLRYCAFLEPLVAYEIRHELSPKRCAVILGYTITRACSAFNDDELKRYITEVEDSIIDHSDIWKVTYGQDWRRLCLSIRFHLGINLGLPGKNVSSLLPDRPTAPIRFSSKFTRMSFF